MNNLESPLSKTEVDSILEFVSFKDGVYHTVDFREKTIVFCKNHPNFKIDFNAIAQGLSVDVVDDFISSKGYTDYYIEIGGELIVRGKNREGVNWKIGIDSPKENQIERELENIIHLSNKAVATSGNYRKFYVKDGVKYSHTLDPKSGFPVQHSLLSVTVVANDCATADAYATAFMVMGKEATLTFIEQHPEEKLEVYLLFSNDKGEIGRVNTVGFDKFLN